MTLKEINQLEKSYWSKKVDNLRREAREAKAVMFGEDLETLFENYRISETNAEITRRLQLAKPANQEDFETVINYISNYFDLDSVELNMSESVFNWVNENDIEGFFTDSVLPTMIASPNSFITMLPREVNGLLDMELTLVDFEQVIYEDNDQFIFRVELAEDYCKPLYRGMSTSKSDIIILNKEGGFLYTHDLELLSEITYPDAVDKYWFKLGGLKTMNLRGFFQSYFKGSIDKSVIATRIFSDKEIIRMRVGNPITVMRRLPCTACADSSGGSCSSCNGTGNVELTPSIGSIFYFNEYDVNGTGKTNLNDIISYIQPPLDSVKVQREEYELHSKEVKEGLNNFYYKHAQSGVAKEVDREDKVASTEVILLRLFTLASNLLNAYSQIVTINKEIVSIVVPNELVTNSEIPLASSNIPAGELAERLLNYYKNKYKDDAVSYRLYSYAIMNDFLFPYSAAEKKTLGTETQVSFSNQLPLAIMNVEAKYKDRVRTAPDKTIKKWLEEFILTTETVAPVVPTELTVPTEPIEPSVPTLPTV